MAAGTLEFNGVVRLTRVGTGYLLFTLVVGFAAMNTGNNSLYIALAIMLGGLIVSGVASKGGLKGIELEFVRVDEAWARQPAFGVIRATNRSRLWNVRDVVLTCDDLERPILFPLLERGATLEIETRFLFRKRGRVELKKASLYTRYPFALFLKKRTVSFQGETIVYPRLLSDAPELLPSAQGHPDMGRTDRFGPGSELLAFREYAQGDSLRQVHWRKSASLGKWITKQTELESSQSVEIAVDPVMPPGTTEEQFERMVSEAATYLRDALASHTEVTLHLPSGTLRGAGLVARRPMFEALALLEPAGEGWGDWTDEHTVVFSLRNGHEPRAA